MSKRGGENDYTSLRGLFDYIKTRPNKSVPYFLLDEPDVGGNEDLIQPQYQPESQLPQLSEPPQPEYQPLSQPESQPLQPSEQPQPSQSDVPNVSDSDKFSFEKFIEANIDIISHFAKKDGIQGMRF